jgi:hypothetical protein
MNLIRAWLRIDLRRRWRSLAVLALLIAVATGTVLTAVAGARRGDSVMDRLNADAAPATALVAPNQPGFDWDAVRRLPEVAAVGELVVGRLEIPLAEPGLPVLAYPGVGDDTFRTLERPAVVRGRLENPARADEAVVTSEFVDRYGLGVGDSVTALLYTPEQVKAAGDAGPGEPRGPRLRIRIVGEVRLALSTILDAGDPRVQPSAGLFREYRYNFFIPESDFVNAFVRLHGGEASLPAFQAKLADLSGRSDIEVRNTTAMVRRLERSFSFQARCLLAFGAAALIASLLLVGQALARFTTASVADLQVLRALGLTPRQAAAASATGPSLAALGGTTAGVAAAAIASGWFPIGSAARLEPTPGLLVDWLVLGAGWLAVPALVLAGSVVTARRALGRERGLAGSARRSAVATSAARAGLPVPVVVGTRFALETGRGRTAVPVRPALVGAVAGVLGVLGALTFSSGVADAADHPERFGQTWELDSFAGFNGEDWFPAEQAYRTVARDPDVAGVNDALIAVAHAGSGDVAVNLFTYHPIGAPIDVVLSSGRLPATDTEVVLAPSSAAALGARVGDRLPFTAPEGIRTLTVTGIGFVPIGPHNDYETGGWVTKPAFDALFGTAYKFHMAQVALRPGANRDAVLARLLETTGTTGDGEGLFFPPRPPSVVAELRQVRQLPVALGVFLALLAVGAVGHALATAVRRRRHDVAVLRALGMTRWQSRGVVVTQATVLALVGLAFGVPLGIALGRTVWRVVADYTPLHYVPPLAFWALVLVGPLALLVANLLAAWPGHQAARLRIGHVLRAE